MAESNSRIDEWIRRYNAGEGVQFDEIQNELNY